MVVEIPIILAADENYAKYMYITILSALENKNDKTIYKFFLLVPKEFEEKTSNYFYDLEKKYKNTSIKFVEMREDFQNHTMSIRHITSPTYYRLRAAELLRSYDKSIYLDVDVIINKDLSELYDIELGDNYIAGVKAATYIMKKYNLKYYKSIGLPETSQYINAGVTLWNLAKIREDNLSEKLFELSMQNFSSMDQDVINVAFYNNIKHLDLKYNLMTKYDNFQKPKRSEYKKLAEIYGDENIKNALKNPVIIHYADQRKPWNCDSVMLSKYWWRYAKMSPYYKEIYKTYRKKYPRIKQVFQVTNVGVHKVITILGVKLKIKSKKLVERQRFASLENRINVVKEEITELNSENKKLCEKYDKQISDLKLELDKANDKISLLEDKNSCSPEKFPIRLSDDEKNKIIDNLKLSKSYLEFGAGGSTFIASINSNCEIISVESDNSWIKYIKEWRVLDKVDFRYVNIGKIKSWGKPANEDYKSDWSKYSSEVFCDDKAKKADLVFIDGRFRVACTLAAIMNCSDDVKIMIHDFWNRPQYHVLLNYLDTLDKVETLGVFKKKVDINYDEISELYKKYCENYE